MIQVYPSNIWKDIPNYEGIYQASIQGEIRIVDGKITSNKRYNTRRWRSRVMKGKGNNPKTGKRVTLWKNGEKRDFLVARLVAITFLGFPPDGFTVNHKDGNRMNNSIDNLEWLSIGDNIRHGFETGLYSAAKKISVCRGESYYRFRSYSELDRFLRRSKGYTSRTLKIGGTILDKDGNAYEVR